MACQHNVFMKNNCILQHKISETVFTFAVGRIVAPYGVHILFPRTWEYVTLNGKRNFTDVIRIKDPEMGSFPGLSRRTQSPVSLKVESHSRLAVVGRRSEREMGCCWL